MIWYVGRTKWFLGVWGCIFVLPTNEKINLMNLIRKIIFTPTASPKVVDAVLMIVIFTMTVVFKANKMMPFFLD